MKYFIMAELRDPITKTVRNIFFKKNKCADGWVTDRKNAWAFSKPAALKIAERRQSYRADLTLDQFDIISDNCRYFNITKETEFSLVIDSYMTVSIHFNNNFLGIGEEFVIIL